MNSIVTVIVPVYNCCKYIYKCVLSILNQDYPYLDVIVIDDSSTDNSFNIVNQIKDARLRVIKKTIVA